MTMRVVNMIAKASNLCPSVYCHQWNEHPDWVWNANSLHPLNLKTSRANRRGCVAIQVAASPIEHLPSRIRDSLQQRLIGIFRAYVLKESRWRARLQDTPGFPQCLFRLSQRTEDQGSYEAVESVIGAVHGLRVTSSDYNVGLSEAGRLGSLLHKRIEWFNRHHVGLGRIGSETLTQPAANLKDGASQIREKTATGIA